MKVDPAFQRLIRPLNADEAKDLEADIVAHGVLSPLIIWDEENILVDGHHRHAICERLGLTWPEKRISFRARDQVEEWIIRSQFGRRNLSAFEHGELALKLKAIWAERGKKQQAYVAPMENPGFDNVVKARDPVSLASPAPAAQPKPAPQPQPAPRPQPIMTMRETINTRRELAKASGLSEGTIAKVEVIAAKAPEPVKEALRKGETTINKVFKEITKAERKVEQVATIKAAELRPSGKFHVIAMDPPWSYEKRPNDATQRGQTPYPTMTIQDLAAMDIPSVCEENCILWLWTTNAFMEQAYQLARGWGFTIKTILTWVKDRMGTGDWLRGKSEHCLMCVRGRPLVTLTNQTTILEGPVREHSRKPDEFFALVESLCPGLKLEMFSREPRTGWTCIGAELGVFGAK